MGTFCVVFPTVFLSENQIGNGRNTVSRVLFRRRLLIEFFVGKLSEFCEKKTR